MYPNGSCLQSEVIIISPASWPLRFPSSRATQVCLWVSSCQYSPRWLELLGYKGPTLVLGEPVAESQVGSWRGLWGCFEFYRGKELWESLRPPARKKGAWGSNLGLTSSRNWIFSKIKRLWFPQTALSGVIGWVEPEHSRPFNMRLPAHWPWISGSYMTFSFVNRCSWSLFIQRAAGRIK